MSDPIIEVDLHGMYQEEAIRVNDKTIAPTDSRTYHLMSGDFLRG